MTARESIEEMADMLADEDFLYVRACARCGEKFYTPIRDESVCSICERVHRILSAVEIGGDG